MNHYITVIRKSDFTDLFKFGYQYVNNDRLIEFDGDVSALPNNTAIKEKLFSEVNPFDYTFTILLIHIEAELRLNGLIYIEEVRNIYPLDFEAKREIENSFDERIRIEQPLWPDFTVSIQEQFLYENAKKGASNIWNILKIEQPINTVSDILPDTDLKELLHEVLNAGEAHGKRSFWYYLLRYQRHGYFPKNSIGYFMDLVNVFINFKNKQELPAESVECTNIFHDLEKLSASGKQLNVKDIIEILGENENGRNFFNAIQEAATNNNAVIIAVLFLVFKSTFVDGFKLDNSARKILDYSTKEFPEGVNYALYLLGIFLGNDHTFECLYETLPLAIFKDKKQEPLGHKVKAPQGLDERDIKIHPESVEHKSDTLFDDDSILGQHYPIKLVKMQTKTVNNEKELKKYIKMDTNLSTPDYTYQQKIAMMRILLDIINADGIVDTRETFFFNQLMATFDMSEEDRTVVNDKNSLLALVQIGEMDHNQKSFFSSLMDKMIIVDGDINVNEVAIYDAVSRFCKMDKFFDAHEHPEGLTHSE